MSRVSRAAEALGRHTSDGAVHLTAAILLAGTLAGTAFTYSAGQLRLDGRWEMVVSVGGICWALEVAGVLMGLRIGTLDHLIKSASTVANAQRYRAMQRDLIRWFCGILTISVVANFVYRLTQLHNGPLAALVAFTPPPLIVVLTIKLRSLPPDYAERNRHSVDTMLDEFSQGARRVAMNWLKRMYGGYVLSPDETRNLIAAVSIMTVSAATSERNAIDYALRQLLPPTSIVETEPVDMMTTSDIQSTYGLPERTAQLWASQCPGARKTSSGAWIAPADELARVAAMKPRRRRTPAQITANGAQPGASEPPTAATEPQDQEGEAYREDGEAS